MHRLRSPSPKDKSCLFQRTMAEWPGMEKTVLRHIALVKKAISNVLILEIKGYLLISTTVLISHVTSIVTIADILVFPISQKIKNSSAELRRISLKIKICKFQP